MPTIELFFDAASESRVRTLWDEFAFFGSAFMRDSGARPHITLAACESVDVAAAGELLDRFAASTPSFAVSLSSFGLFPAEQSAAYLAPKVTSELLTLHVRFLMEFSAVARHCCPLYSPEQWVPHCTLAPDLSPQHLGPALDLCRSSRLPLTCTISEIGLVDYWPCQQLYVKPLYMCTSRKESMT
ncbi:MAG TPA: 2'-5' RNA ligase family protein [Chthoniobacterales bacterium]